MFKCLSSSRDLVAIKKVSLDRLDGDAVRNYLNEIALLKSLRGDEKVIRLDDEETTRGTGGRPKAILVVRPRRAPSAVLSSADSLPSPLPPRR